ncbi:MAG TPA: DUF4397 domain-containing protein [Gemmatimonadaceae bacterium]|nr:DUF4397 domain-containing protein [Gemmatimonadaceae bacterium]
MRLKSVVMLGLAAAVFTGCDDDEVTNVVRPPLAGVRIINGITEGWAIDLRAVNQIEWTPVANNLAYRHSTIHTPTEAGKPLHLRVFSTSTVAEVTSVVMLEENITFQANSRVTLLVTGSTAAGNVRFVVINDDLTPPAATNIGVRLVNVSGAAVDGYLVATPTTAIAGAPTWSNVGPIAASAYVERAAGAAAARITAAGSIADPVSAQGPTAPADPSPGVLPAAGVNTPLTRFSVYYFPAVQPIGSFQGRPAVVETAASAIWYVDRNPAD